MRLFLVVTQWNRFELMKETGAKNFLVTYSGIGQGMKEKEFRKLVQAMKKDERLMVDSGAHPIIQNALDVGDIENFVDRYIGFIQRYYDHIYTFVELDVEQKFGQDAVDGWYRKIKKMDKDNKCMRVLHPHHTTERWRRYCKDNRFVGIGGGWFTDRKAPHRHTLHLLKYAFDHQVKVHGFGCAGTMLARYPFYSSDSNTWMVSEMYGQHLEFTKGRLILHRSAKKTASEGKEETGRAHPSVFASAEYRKRRAIEACMQYEDYLSKLWNLRGVKWQEI